MSSILAQLHAAEARRLDPPDRDAAQTFIDGLPEWLRNEYAGEFVEAKHADEFDDFLRERFEESRIGARES